MAGNWSDDKTTQVVKDDVWNIDTFVSNSTTYEKHIMFHNLWSECVGTVNYDKKDWLFIEIQLINANIISERRDE